MLSTFLAVSTHAAARRAGQVVDPRLRRQLIIYAALRGKKPNHLLMHAWSFAVFARKLFLQALRQKRRPQWWWQTRPNFPPQFAQRFSNLVMRLSSSLEVGRAVRWRSNKQAALPRDFRRINVSQ
jgi:hypothetical protein